jgi:hypothetical protein
VVDALVVHGSPARCREHLVRYVDAGIGTPVIALLPTPELAAGGAETLANVLAGLGGTA